MWVSHHALVPGNEFTLVARDGATNFKAMKQKETLAVTGHGAHFPDGLMEK